jgi:hypothetical protein
MPTVRPYPGNFVLLHDGSIHGPLILSPEAKTVICGDMAWNATGQLVSGTHIRPIGVEAMPLDVAQSYSLSELTGLMRDLQRQVTSIVNTTRPTKAGKKGKL